MNKKAVYMLLGAFLAVITLPAACQEEGEAVISLLIDVDIPPSSDLAQIRSAEIKLHDLFGAITRRGGTATIMLTEDVSSSRIRLLLAQYSVLSSFEFGVSGSQSSEQLSSMSFADQKASIARSLAAAEAARVCGMSEVHVMGFLPPGFDQNTDTYRAIDDLGLMYNAGFQAGVIYEPDHEEDVWPYQVEGHNFYALPLSTADVDGELLPLYDKKMAEEGISASEWADILKEKYDEASAAKEPMVILISTSVSGSDEYYDGLRQFLDYAVSNNGTFANARDLVNFVKTGILAPPEVELSECIDCEEDEIMEVSIRLTETPAPEPADAVDEETPETEDIEIEA